MAKTKALLAALPMSAAVLAGSGSVASAFSNIGLDTAGPSQFITYATDGSVSITNNSAYTIPPAHPYDGSEDTYIGVINNSPNSISSINITCAPGCFGFDGDGIGTYSAPPGGGPLGTNSSDTSSGKYGGPNAYFTNISGNSGTVNFITPIPNGGTDVFSLEEALSATSITIGAVPLPSSWTMMLIGFAGLGFLSYRARKKTSEAIATA